MVRSQGPYLRVMAKGMGIRPQFGCGKQICLEGPQSFFLSVFVIVIPVVTII